MTTFKMVCLYKKSYNNYHKVIEATCDSLLKFCHENLHLTMKKNVKAQNSKHKLH